MAREAIPQKESDGFLQKFFGGAQRHLGVAPEQIAQDRLRNERARLVNSLSKLDLILKNSKDPNTGNEAAIKFLLDSKIINPEQAGQLDFTKTIKKNLSQIGVGEQFTLSPGQERFTGEGGPIAQVPAKPTAPKQSSSVITDPRDPNKAIRVRNTFDEQGNLINQQFIGEATLAERIGGVAPEGLQKSTQTKMEKDIIELQTTLTELDAIDKQFDENFFTFIGKGEAALTAFFEKAKIPVGAKQKEFLSKKTKFFADSKRVFLKFRKFITGVAGGIEEFREIAKATIDPEGDSPTQFKAKMTSMKDNAKRTQNVLLAIRNSGLDPQSKTIRKHIFRGLSLETIPVDVLGNVTLETITQQQIPTPKTQADFDAIPSGTEFIDTDGKKKVKQ